LFWLTAEAVAAKNRGDHSGRIDLGNSLSDFMFQLGLDPSSRGPRSDARRLRDQMDRLFNASISFESQRTEDGRRGDERINMAVAAHTMLWWSPRDPSQAALWDSYIDLSREFFVAITAHPVPLDVRALKALKRSSLALDLYSWLTYESYRAHKSGRGRFVAWKQLAEQMGADYVDPHDFQKKAVGTLRKIQALYPALRLGPLRGGIRIEPDSLPAITPRDLRGGRRSPPPPARAADAATTSLATREQFTELRRGLSAAEPDRLPAPKHADLDKLRERVLATSSPKVREAALVEVKAILQRALERGDGLDQIDFNLTNGAVVSIRPDLSLGQASELRAELEEAHNLLRYILGA
jgi:hypothetical protein